MLPTAKRAVLFTDGFMDDHYHILLENGEVIRSVLITDRRANAQNYEVLYWWMKKLDINRLWVHPDNMLSLWCMRSDFQFIKKTPDGHILNWSSPEQMLDGHPKGIRMYYVGDVTRWLFFPEHIDMLRADRMHQHNKKHGTWSTPSPDHLFNTVAYLEDTTENAFLWSPAYSSKLLLRSIHKNCVIVPFQENDAFKRAYHKMVTRPVWVARRRSGIRGLSKEVADFPYWHGFDKSMQYLGACVSNTLPNQADCEEVGPDMWDRRSVAFWEYKILDVGNSDFNSYDCYCPLDMRRNWASTSVINFALDAGIKLDILRGLLFDRASAGRYLDTWAHVISDAMLKLRNDPITYHDAIASTNAQGSFKKYYVDMIGQFCAEYSDEYQHRDWNTMIVHEAIARQGYTILSRPELRRRVFLVVNDAFYVASNEPDPMKAFPTLLKNKDKLQGYKLIGTCAATKELIEMFDDTKITAAELEAQIQGAMEKYATIR